MFGLADEIKSKLEATEGYSLTWTADDFMEVISNVSECRDYFMKSLTYMTSDDLNKEKFKVWEIKDPKLLGDIIDQVERK